VLELWLVAGDRRTEGSKAGREDLDTIEICACFIERAIKRLTRSIVASVAIGNLITRVGVKQPPGDGSGFRLIDRISINKT
jgi:hypothetical protein